MTDSPSLDTLADELEAALALLADFDRPGDTVSPEPLPSLLAQCEALCAGFSRPEPLRSIHHFACSGGTLIAKCISALPTVVLLSEIDPLSRMRVAATTPEAMFAPTDLLLPLLRNLRQIDDAVVVEMFQAAVATGHAALSLRGQRLVLRDHAHSQFCMAVDPDQRPTLQDILTRTAPTLSVVTVRHPLDSFASLRALNWRTFEPFDLQDYSQRYLRFLDRHASLPVLRYEDFVANPQDGLQRLCGWLDLPYDPLALDLIAVIRLSGDSGRSDVIIAPRPRREIAPDLQAAREDPQYLRLCARLGYDP